MPVNAVSYSSTKNNGNVLRLKGNMCAARRAGRVVLSLSDVAEQVQELAKPATLFCCSVFNAVCYCRFFLLGNFL